MGTASGSSHSHGTCGVLETYDVAQGCLEHPVGSDWPAFIRESERSGDGADMLEDAACSGVEPGALEFSELDVADKEQFVVFVATKFFEPVHEVLREGEVTSAEWDDDEEFHSSIQQSG
jgi:hypothetical protein